MQLSLRFFFLFLSVGIPGSVQLSLLPAGLAGVWSGNVTTSPGGPLVLDFPHKRHTFLEVSSPDAEGNVFMRQHDFNQLFKIQPDFKIQYCVGGVEATFTVVPARCDNTTLTICWRGPRLPSHKTGCTGCDCAMWTLKVNGDMLSSVFQQTPPAVHMSTELVRTGAPADPAELKAFHTGPNGKYQECLVSNNTGPDPDPITPGPPPTAAAPRQRALGCPFSRLVQKPPRTSVQYKTNGRAGPVNKCMVLNRHLDVRLRYIVPTVPCMPCAVHYTFSMKADPGNYIALGFKELEATYANWYEVPKDVGNYWGMSYGGSNSTRQSPFGGRILGTTGSCVRHLNATAFIGELLDVEDDGWFTDLRAERSDGRVSISFTTPPMNYGETEASLTWAGYEGMISTQRLMWASGPAESDDCSKTHTYGYHSGTRGLIWPGFSTVDEEHQLPGFFPLTATCTQ